MSNALVINLTRFGDLIQSQAVIDDLHQSGYAVGLICQNNFAAALPLLRNLADSWLLPGSRLLAALNSDWQSALADLIAFSEAIRDSFKPDVILNLTPTLPARLLASLLAGPQTRTLGFGIDTFGYGINHDVWASFFSVAATGRANSPFNLADLMRCMALPVTRELRGSFRLAAPEAGSIEKARALLAPATPCAGFIAFQLGASQDNRRWPVSSFRELGEIVWRRTGLIPLLLGSEGEKPLGQEYVKSCAHPFVDVMGKTDIPTLSALLAEAKLLVTNDTGTMHLAAGLGRPIVALFLATAQPWDTGPLVRGACSLEPALECHPCAFERPCNQRNKCRTHISPPVVAQYVLAKLAGADLAQIETTTARAWLTDTDEKGFTRIKPLGKFINGPGIWLGWQRIFWDALLQDVENLHLTPMPALLALYEGLHVPAQEASLTPALAQSAELFQTISGLCPVAMTNPRMSKILLRNSERLQALLDASGCGALAAFWREFRLNQGDDLERFGKQVAIMSQHVKALATSMARNLQ